MIKLGNFQVSSGLLYVQDPCYERGSDATFKSKSGLWNAFIEYCDDLSWGRRVKSLVAKLWDEDAGCGWTPAERFLPVDSGQMGVFDADTFSEDCYDEYCSHTLSEIRAGVGKTYAVSSSGYGDGSYQLFFKKNDNDEVVAVKVEFITDADGVQSDESYWEEYDDDDYYDDVSKRDNGEDWD